MRVEYRAASPADTLRIARDMREIEVLECQSAGLAPRQALRLGLAASSIAWTATIDGKPEAMFGVVPVSVILGEGRPWMLSTYRAARAARHLLADPWPFLEHVHALFPVLANKVHAHNVASIRWLTRLGFVVEPELVHIGDQPFRRFHRFKHVRAGHAHRRDGVPHL